jgi:hypothetical protein
MIALMGIAVLTAQSALGFSGHDRPKPGCCDVCGVENARVSSLLVALQTCPQWRARHDAAHDLRKFDWHCHPEIIDGLTTALLTDCDQEVREESAQSLKKLAACTPTSHAALQRAAKCDPDWATRFWAKRALAAIKHKCPKDCEVCQPGVVVGVPVVGAPPVIQGEPALGTPLVPEALDAVPPNEAMRPPSTLVPAPDLPPADLPPPAPGPSPFRTPRSSSPDGAPKLEAPMQEAKRSDGQKRSRVVKLIPGLRAIPPIFGTRPSQ